GAVRIDCPAGSARAVRRETMGAPPDTAHTTNGEARMTVRATALGIAVVLTLAMGAGRPAWAGAPTEQLRTQIDRVIKVLEDPEMAKEARMVERRTMIRRVANDIFDFSETTRRSLGPHWHARTPQEREDVTRLYADLLERSYIGTIEMYSGEKIQ